MSKKTKNQKQTAAAPPAVEGIRLLKRQKLGFFAPLFSRLGIVLLLLLLQILVIFGVFRTFEEFLPHIYGAMIVISALMVLYILNSTIDPTAKITWLVIITLLPIFGALLFLYTKRDVGHRELKRRADLMIKNTHGCIPADEDTAAALKAENPGVSTLAAYVNRTGCYPVYQNTDATYFPSGESLFPRLLEELKSAKKFIFLEFFIVGEGVMWGKILEILAQKVKEGVEVRLLYDGTCELSLLPHRYPKLLQELGIQCKMFAPITPFVSTHYNYRDHRKILVIDGETALTGGINLADEYINQKERFGYWKDVAVLLKGEAVRSFTLMFLQMWSMDEKNCKTETFSPYLLPPENPPAEKGFVMPFGDCPLDNDKVGEHVYIDMLNRATDYVYIMTPYLILDGEMEDALRFAAERGVDVRLILPGIPDKRIPYALALTHYKSLLSSGIRIFEYTPGFVHAKIFVADGKEAVVGTINLDYRSLYHHFECAAYLYKVEGIEDIKRDYLATEEDAKEVTVENLKHQKFYRKLIGPLMKVLSPLL